MLMHVSQDSVKALYGHVTKAWLRNTRYGYYAGWPVASRECVDDFETQKEHQLHTAAYFKCLQEEWEMFHRLVSSMGEPF